MEKPAWLDRKKGLKIIRLKWLGPLGSDDQRGIRQDSAKLKDFKSRTSLELLSMGFL